jgi:ATP-dependent DNA helicase RecQ
VWDGTDAARKLLSTVYRAREHSGFGFGAGHIMDVVRGKSTEKVRQYDHERLSTFGLGAAYSEAQLRSVLRQLVALGAVAVDAQAFNTLQLTEASRAVLKGEVTVRLRESVRAPTGKAARGTGKGRSLPAALATLDALGQARYAALKAWRGEVARSHNLPAYVIFHDATLMAIAQRGPHSQDDLAGVSGMGEKKRLAYGEEVVALCRRVTA